MGVYARPDSPWWWLWLENAPPGQQREKTQIRIGTTKETRTDSRRRAQQLYAKRLDELAAGIHHLSSPRPTTRFAAWAAWYDTHVIVHHKGREREREILPRLVRDFGDYFLHEIDKDRVIEWRTRRLTTPTQVERFGATRRALPVWLQIHRYLQEHGPTPLAQLKTVFKLTTRNVSRTYLRPETAQYFARERRGVWRAVGTPALQGRTIRPPSPRTVNREVDLLQQILAAAVPKYFDVSPLEGLRDLEVTPPMRRTMSVDEEQRLLAELGQVDRAIFLVGLDTLTRFGDILDLKRSDDHGATLDVQDPKNRRPHTVPISQRLRAALDAVPVDAKHPDWYFPTRRRGATERARRKVFANALKKACARAGVPYGRAQGGLTFHWSTRRTGATRMIRAGGERAIATTRQIGNWKNVHVLLDIYQEVVTDEMRAAVESVGADSRSRSTPDRKGRKSEAAEKHRRKKV